MAQVYLGFSAYAVRLEVFFGKVGYLVAYIIVACNYETSIAADKRVTYRKGLQATVIFLLKVRRANVVSNT